MEHICDYAFTSRTRCLRYFIRRSQSSEDLPDLCLTALFDANFGMQRPRFGVIIGIGTTSDSYDYVFARSFLSPTVAHSTAEAELSACSFASRTILGFYNFLTDLGFHVNRPMDIFGDNSAANLIAMGSASLRAVRHISLARLFARECCRDGLLQLQPFEADR